MHQADPEGLPGLEKYFSSQAAKNSNVLRLVINVIAAVPQEKAVPLLSKISYDESIDAGLRKAAQEALATIAARKAIKFSEPDADMDVAQHWAAAGRTS